MRNKWQDLHCEDNFSLLPKGELSFEVFSNEDTSPIEKATGSPTQELLAERSGQCNDPLVDDLLFGSPATKLSPKETSSLEQGKANLGSSDHEDKEDNKLLMVSASGNDSAIATKASSSSSSYNISESQDLLPNLTHSISNTSSEKKRVLPGWMSSVPTTEKKLSTVSKGTFKKPKSPLLNVESAVTKRTLAERSESLDENSTSPPPIKVHV